MCIVALLSLILDVSNVNSDTALFFFRGGVDLIKVILRVQIWVLFMKYLGNSRRKGRLTVINVTNGTDVDVRLSAFVLGLCHKLSSWTSRSLSCCLFKHCCLSGSQATRYILPVFGLVVTSCPRPEQT